MNKKPFLVFNILFGLHAARPPHDRVVTTVTDPSLYTSSRARRTIFELIFFVKLYFRGSFRPSSKPYLMPCIHFFFNSPYRPHHCLFSVGDAVWRDKIHGNPLCLQARPPSARIFVYGTGATSVFTPRGQSLGRGTSTRTINFDSDQTSPRGALPYIGWGQGGTSSFVSLKLHSNCS